MSKKAVYHSLLLTLLSLFCLANVGSPYWRKATATEEKSTQQTTGKEKKDTQKKEKQPQETTLEPLSFQAVIPVIDDAAFENTYGIFEVDLPLLTTLLARNYHFIPPCIYQQVHLAHCIVINAP